MAQTDQERGGSPSGVCDAGRIEMDTRGHRREGDPNPSTSQESTIVTSIKAVSDVGTRYGALVRLHI